MYDRFVFANAAESHALTEPEGVVEPERALQLVSARTGYADWQIVFPGSVVMSAAAANLFGLPADDGAMPLQDMVKLYHMEDRGKLLAMIAQALDGRRGFHCRLRLDTRDGNLRMIETIADLRVRDGKVLGLFGLSRDATQEVDREIAAAARMKLMQEMVEDMPCPVVMLDDKLRVLDCSIMWLKAHRFVERREVVGKTLVQLFGTMPPDIVAEFERAMKGQTVKTKRSFVSPTTNQGVLFNTVLTPWFLSERKVGGVMVTTGWSEIAVSKAQPKEPEVDEGFEGSLLELLKTVS